MDEFPEELIDSELENILINLREKDPCRTCEKNCRSPKNDDVPCPEKNEWWDMVRKELLDGH